MATSDSQPGDASPSAEPPAQSRLTRLIDGIRNHPVWLLMVLIASGVIFLGQVGGALPGISNLVSGVRGVLPDEEPRPDLAYASDRSIVLRPSDGDASTLAALTDETVLELRWSDDGRRLAALLAHQGPGDTYPHISERRVWYRDLTSQEEGFWTCTGCNGLSFSGDKLLSLADGDSVALNVFSLDALPQALPLTGADWGPEQQAESVVQVLGGGRQGVLFAVADPEGISAQGGPQLIYRVAETGETAYLGRSDSSVAIQIAATRPNGREIAVRYTEHSSACENWDSVAVINLANSSRRELPQPETDEAWRTSSIAWAPDGSLYTTRYALSRAREDCGEMIVEPHVARWDGNSWERLPGTDSSLAVFLGDGGALATIRITVDDQWAGDLVVRSAGEEEWQDVADDVLTAAWRPLGKSTG